MGTAVWGERPRRTLDMRRLQLFYWHDGTNKQHKNERKNSAAGTRTRVARVRAEYPNQLDYSGSTTTRRMQMHLCKILRTRRLPHIRSQQRL